MRMRKKKHGAERIAACSELLIEDIELLRDGFDRAFPTRKPVHMEIGCGKGNFAVGMAQNHSEINFVAVEKVSDVACVALEKAKARSEERAEDNLRFIIGDAKNLAENVKPHSLDCIYLNFSDPWPKSGHAKRRLTYRAFLEIYRELLVEGGTLKLKTDNVGLFDFTLEELEAVGATVLRMTRDLHKDWAGEENIMTEYEKSFSDKGMPICSVWVRF